MLKILSLFLALLSTSAFAQLNTVARSELPTLNVLLNPGFENGLADWSASGGTFAAASSGNIGYGSGAATWTASAGSQTLTSTQVTIPKVLYGQACAGILNYKGGDANLSFKVIDGSSSNLGTPVTLAVQSNYARAIISFTCPTSGTFALRISSSASAAAISIDQLFLGASTLTAFTNPMSATGDIIYSSDNSGTPARLPIGSATQVLHGGTTPSYSAVSLTSDVSNTLPMGNGGTGHTSFTSNGVILGNGSSALAVSSAGSADNIFRVPGAGGTPDFGSIDLSKSAAVGSSILAVGNGGTGIASGTSGGVPYYSTTSTIASSGALTSNALVKGGGAGSAPSSLALGTANQMLGMNSGATANEYKTLSTGTTGSDFNIAHAANSVTFHLPDASATARGAVSTSTQTFEGAKTLNKGMTTPNTATSATTVAAATTMTHPNLDTDGVVYQIDGTMLSPGGGAGTSTNVGTGTAVDDLNPGVKVTTDNQNFSGNKSISGNLSVSPAGNQAFLNVKSTGAEIKVRTDASGTSDCFSGNLCSGTYTTGTNPNCSVGSTGTAVPSHAMRIVRLGNQLLISGTFDFNPTVTTVNVCEVNMPPSMAGSLFSNATSCGGTYNSDQTVWAGIVRSKSSSTNVEFVFKASATGSNTSSYIVICTIQ